jgi:hypothetical protein
MAGLVPAIHVFERCKDVAPRNKSGDDVGGCHPGAAQQNPGSLDEDGAVSSLLMGEVGPEVRVRG